MTERRFERALVTGASSGIGRRLAERLAAEGSDLVVVARSTDDLEELAAELEGRWGVTGEVLTADLSTPGGIAEVTARLTEGPAVDLLVNHAGTAQTGRFADTEIDRAARQITLNVEAVVRLTHAGVRRMRRAGRGAVLITASTAAFQPMPRMAVYGASKAFVNHFGQALHEELRDTGVTVTVLCPGFTRTDFLGDLADRLPSALLMEPEPVARAALRGVRRGQAVVTPGVVNKAHRILASTAPSALLRRLSGRTH